MNLQHFNIFWGRMNIGAEWTLHIICSFCPDIPCSFCPDQGPSNFCKIIPSHLIQLLNCCCRMKLKLLVHLWNNCLYSFTRLFKFYSLHSQRGEIAQWALSISILLGRFQNNEAALCCFGGLPGAMLKTWHSTDSNWHITGTFYGSCSFCPYVHSAPVSPNVFNFRLLRSTIEQLMVILDSKMLLIIILPKMTSNR